MQKVNYGMIIKNMRVKKKLTQEELGKKIGVGKSTISSYEKEKIMPSIGTFFQICSICGVEILFKTSEQIYTMKEFNREY